MRRLLIWSKSINHLVQHFNCTFMLRLFTNQTIKKADRYIIRVKQRSYKKQGKKTNKKSTKKLGGIGLGVGWRPGRPGSSYNLASYVSTLCTHCSSKYGDLNIKIVKSLATANFLSFLAFLQ